MQLSFVCIIYNAYDQLLFYLKLLIEELKFNLLRYI